MKPDFKASDNAASSPQKEAVSANSLLPLGRREQDDSIDYDLRSGEMAGVMSNVLEFKL